MNTPAPRKRSHTEPLAFVVDPPPLGIKGAIARVCERKDLSAEEMASVVGEIMDGQTTAAQIGGLLTALRSKGETVDEVVGAARAMRARMTRVALEGAGAPVVDTCGTGGDGSGSVNVSTLAAVIVAACGVPVAKHGNRALSSRAGSHDVIEALGLNPAPSPELAARCLREVGLAFLFAPTYHAATRHAAAPRKELGVRTVFNLLGPLTNPAGARFAVNGVFSRDRCELLARAHQALGAERVMVVNGAGGLDEFAPSGATLVAELRDGTVRTYEVTPADFGLAAADPEGLRGGEPDLNARMFIDVLRTAPGPARNAAVMTAAAALCVTGHAPDLTAGARRAAAAIDDGSALALLEKLRLLAPHVPPAG
ncbi:MAG: anthranilate phosphoribosyltransferase [Pseudomonadota bacterium]